MNYFTDSGLSVPSVTNEQMREVDRLVVQEFGLQILQMMENAGRNLCELILAAPDPASGPVVVCAGAGGNGGGGMACARHLHNRGVDVSLLIDREIERFGGPAENQLRILQSVGLHPSNPDQASRLMTEAGVVVDALIGYSLKGQPRGLTAELIRMYSGINPAKVISLDVPSGMDATTGDTPGDTVNPGRIMTLALPKTGLTAVSGEIILADIGIPPELYKRMGLSVGPIFGNKYRVRLFRPGEAAVPK